MRYLIPKFGLITFTLTTTAPALGAQTLGPVAGGPYVAASLGVGQPLLSGRAEQAFAGVGDVGGGGGVAFGAGWDASRAGVSFWLEPVSFTIGSARAIALALVATGHWRPAVQFGKWQPAVTVGYVGQAFGAVDVPRAGLPADLRQKVALAGSPDEQPHNLALVGQGSRVGAELTRAISTRSLISVGATVDLLRFSTASYDGFSYSYPDAGWSAMPRIAVGYRWYLMPLTGTAISMTSAARLPDQ
jgi:hypothetical protein